MSGISPFFIIGNPRSGTSLLRLMITSHPNVIVPPESHFFLWLQDKYKNWDKHINLKLVLHDLFESRKFETWKIDYNELLDHLAGFDIDSYGSFVEKVYLYYGVKCDKYQIQAWGDKNKLWKDKLYDILQTYPEGKFVHLIRDGRDVAASFKELAKRNIKSLYAPKLPSEIGAIADRWRENVNFINEFIGTLPPHNVIEVRYEDMLKETKLVLVELSEFLGFEYNSIMLKYADLRFSDKFEPLEFMQWKNKLNHAPDLSNIGRYKIDLSALEIETFERLCSAELKRYRYDH